jgi:hypothetical protein
MANSEIRNCHIAPRAASLSTASIYIKSKPSIYILMVKTKINFIYINPSVVTLYEPSAGAIITDSYLGRFNSTDG